jgi:penicillin-binding protein 1B
MKRAIKLPQYSDVKSFSPPDGITIANIDRESGLLADPTCTTKTMNVAFLDGTAPTGSCSQMNENPQNFFQKIFGLGGQPTKVSPYNPSAPVNAGTSAQPANPAGSGNGNAPQPTAQAEQQKKKKNIFQKIFGGGGDKNNKQPQPNQPPQ